METTPMLSDILGLINKLPSEQRAALYKAVTAGGIIRAREEVEQLAGLIENLPKPIKEAMVKELGRV